jgi:hypothetical protein
MIRQELSVIQITVTDTATSLKDLILAEDSGAEIPAGINAIELNTEGDIRYSTGGTPTTSTGMKLNAEETRILEGIDVHQLKLIASSSTLVNIEIGFKEYN